MFIRVLNLDAGPATLIPLVHVPLLKQAPRLEGEYKVIFDSLGDLCHFYGDFAGYHLYMIATSYKKRILANSLDYFDKVNGMFSVSLSATLDTGELKTIRVEGCQAPLFECTTGGSRFPERISVEQFSPGTPDGIKFHFANSQAKFKFSNNLIPHIPEAIRLSDSGLFDLQVEYIGKAVGVDGSREIADRLGNGHSTESRILNELLHKKTNRDAYAILYKPGRLTDSHEKEEMPYSEIVDILEKSLIASFLPPKNLQSRYFPNDGSLPSHKLIESCVSRLWITANSPLNYGLLFTDNVAPERSHRFDLHVKS